MKILLVQPPSTHRQGSARPSISIPLGLLYIGGFLDQYGYDVEIYDTQLGSQPENLKYKEMGVVRLGDNWDTIEKEIERRAPDIIGISNTYTTQIHNAIRVAEIVKKVSIESIVIMGGNHATVRPEDFFNLTDAVDIVCRGEGEHTMLEIVEAYDYKKQLTNILGTVVKENGKIKMNPERPFIDDLDTLPFPAYHLINLEVYFSLNRRFGDGRPAWHYPGSERTVSVITSRGCPFKCIFCSIHSHMGRKWRSHSSDYVLKHLEFLKTRYNVNHIHFEDDNLTLNSSRIERIVDEIAEKKHKITWDTPNGIRADSLTLPVLKKIKESGCTYIILGVESANLRVLNEIIEKKLNLEKVTTVATWCKSIGFDLHAFFVIGFPGEQISEMLDTLNFALKLYRKYDVLPSLFIATPLFGTRLHKICIEKKYLKREVSPENLARVTGGSGLNGLIETEDFTPEDLHTIVRSFYRKYKFIFLLNCISFFVRNPRLFLPFVRKLNESRGAGIKKSILDIMNLRNCIGRSTI
ncbi:MAG: cobalamin-dependent protein [Candidatus Omnitrophica bacterium]|nr:cobalamin-dependent protein [Candidatus Omnitrophota bacterium]